MYQAVCPLESGVSLMLARAAYIEDHEGDDEAQVINDATTFELRDDTVVNFFSRD